MEENHRIGRIIQTTALAGGLNLQHITNFAKVHGIANGIGDLTCTEGAEIGNFDVTRFDTGSRTADVVELKSNRLVAIG